MTSPDRRATTGCCHPNLRIEAATDLAVGAEKDDGMGGTDADRGAVYLLLMKSDKTVRAYVKIDDATPELSLADGDVFGASLASLGDLNGDGDIELAVGATGDDTACTECGAVWILSIDAAGVLAGHRITEGVGGF